MLMFADKEIIMTTTRKYTWDETCTEQKIEKEPHRCKLLKKILLSIEHWIKMNLCTEYTSQGGILEGNFSSLSRHASVVRTTNTNFYSFLSSAL